MAIPILNLSVTNFTGGISGPFINVQVAPEHLAKIEALELKCAKPKYNDGRIRNSRVVYSDEHCQIVSNRMDDRLILFKTLSKPDKRQFHEEAKAHVSLDIPIGPDTRLEHAVFKAGDMHALHSALDTLGLELKPELLRTLALALGKSADREKMISLDPASLDTRRTHR